MNPSRSWSIPNVVVYAFDASDPWKHQLAGDLLQSLSDEGRLIFSAQVFNEFSSVLMSPNGNTG